MFINTDQSLRQVFSDIKHELHRATHDKRHPFRFLTLASSNEQSPSLRYVVLRDITENFEFIVFTDSRTKKVEHLTSNPKVELLFYHPIKKLQVRASGEAEIHQQNDLSKKYWKEQNHISSLAYNSILPPGTTIEKPQDAHSWPNEMSDKFFAVIKISPKSIEVLQLNNSEHLRAFFELKGNKWNKKWIAP